MTRAFHVQIIKPAHYDDEGYVIQWWKASIQSNSLASLYAIVQDAADRQVLSRNVTLTSNGWDECNTVSRKTASPSASQAPEPASSFSSACRRTSSPAPWIWRAASVPVDCLEFFILTPLPGSEDHRKLARLGALVWRVDRIRRPVLREHAQRGYTDLAIAKLPQEQEDQLELMQERQHAELAEVS